LENFSPALILKIKIRLEEDSILDKEKERIIKTKFRLNSLMVKLKHATSDLNYYQDIYTGITVNLSSNMNTLDDEKFMNSLKYLNLLLAVNVEDEDNSILNASQDNSVFL
jgi:hypothetical protein